jgi:hypothetical protein
MLNHQLTLIELLDDPMTQAVMAADRVDPAALKATLSAVARKLQHNFAAHQQMKCAGSTGQKRFSDNDGRMAQVNRICRMAASTDPRQVLPFVRHVLE